MKRAISRTLFSLGVGAIVATCLYPPWTYGIAAVPHPGADVALCIKERMYAPLWSPPSNSTVSHEQGQTVMCSGPDMDVWILAAQCLAVALVVAAVSRARSRQRAKSNERP